MNPIKLINECTALTALVNEVSSAMDQTERAIDFLDDDDAADWNPTGWGNEYLPSLRAVLLPTPSASTLATVL